MQDGTVGIVLIQFPHSPFLNSNPNSVHFRIIPGFALRNFHYGLRSFGGSLPGLLYILVRPEFGCSRWSYTRLVGIL